MAISTGIRMSIEQPADLALLRLMQLVSPALPVGAYAYSQGLEAAVEAGWVHDEATAAAWIEGVLAHGLTGADLPLLARLHAAWAAQDEAAVVRWTDVLHALRETAELREEDMQLGAALARVLAGLDVRAAEPWQRQRPVAFATLFALAAVHWDIAPRQAMLGYAWTWAENQVAAAIKLVPLGQSAGQRILSGLIAALPARVDEALALSDDALGRSAPGYALASTAHARQYSRLFRS
ncbi:urease accessory protein UreF [Acidihalobacter aeolianus]|uniref:Urease accessory protein UreF n=1 Tax=Acidihalobacter aeolianus TaxID=2792603 RepID=A0A1D8K4V9_9GAMM|nr:urease accessory UreF family protein [Acidihalobacter aeolianus]AOV15990.1 urease accessory protein UreF [Acidihalobacter aeolianus]